jgi:Mg-chelatase subunit ChlI
LIVLAGVDVIFAVVVALLFTVWKEDADKKDLDSELQRINKARPSVSQNTANPIQPTAKLPESGSEESDEEEEEDEDSEEEDDEEESDEEEEEDEEDDDSDNSGSSSGGQQRPAMIAKPSNTGLQAASSEGSEGSSGSEQSSSEGSSGSGSSESS